MSVTQLNPPIPVFIPHLRECGLAHFLIDEGIESHLKWVVFMDKSSEIWVWDNTKVRAQKNITLGRLAEMK